MTKAVEKETDFVPEGMLPDEIEALQEGATDDAAGTTAADADFEAASAADAEAAKTAEAAAKTDEGKADDAAKVDEAKADDAKADEPAKADAADGADAKVVEESVRTTMPKFEAPADAEKQLADIAAKRDALAEQFDNGEINAKTLFAEQAALAKQERTIETAVERANFSAEMTTQAWFQNTVPGFLATHDHYKSNPTLHGMLNAEVVRLQNEAIEKGGDQFDPGILAKADESIRAALSGIGVKTPAAAAKAEPAKDAAKDGKAKIEVEAKPETPPSLRNLPADDITGTDSKWAALDRLADTDAVAYEDAFGRLPAADRDRYLARQ